MSVVFLADDLELGKPVAVKVLRPEIAGGVAVDRFLREITLQSSVRHDNVLPVLDSGECDGIPFLVLPYVVAGSLRNRLAREGHLSWSETLRIARDLASALDAANDAGIVHRDVKPENVLLGADRTLLSDFGIARAFSEAATERLTESGIVIGTAGYMSPEQCEGERVLDRRSDVYSLACVVYEMLAGEAPYTGPSRVAIVAKQMTLPVPSVRLVRNAIPDTVDDVLRTALAKVPADRYQRAGEFVDALAAAGLRGHRRWLTRRRKEVTIGTTVVALLAYGLFNTERGSGILRGGASAVDTTAYLVFPFDQDDSISGGASRVRAAMLDWTGMRVVDDARVRDALRGRNIAQLTGADLSAAARRLKAGRYVRGEIRTTAGATALRLRLYDSRGDGTLLGEAAGAIGGPGRSDSGAINILVDSILLRGGADDERPRAGNRRSLPSRQYFLQGERALGTWDLARAEVAFDSAAALDTGYVRPRLALALVRSWVGAEPARWRIAAEQAAVGADRLAPRERLTAEAIVAQSRGDLGRACPLWEEAIRLDTLNALSWFGSAQCKVSDDLVLPDPRSPSGLRFRTSYHRALQEYQRSFQLRPSILSSFRDRSFESLRRLFKTSGSDLRVGRATTPTSDRYTANLSWAGDSLALVPYPLRSAAPHISRNRASLNEALRRQRELVRSVASAWVGQYPLSTDALQALAVALAQLGDRSALDTLARARTLAREPAARQRVMAADAALQLAFGVADGDTTRILRVRAMADTLIASERRGDAVDPILLTSLAALTGRAALAARLASTPEVAVSLTIPLALRDGVPSFLVYSSLGGPKDSLAFLERHVLSLIDRTIEARERPQRRLEFVGRGASMAYPSYASPLLATLGAEGDPLCAMEAAFLGGEPERVRAGLEEVRLERREILPESMAIDALVPEAELLWQLGDASGARDWIAPTLAALPHEAQRLLSSPVRAATLVRALLIRARAEAAMGNQDAAQRFARSLVILWSDADAFLQPAVAEARRLMSRPVAPR